jgi:hypothetical protein
MTYLEAILAVHIIGMKLNADEMNNESDRIWKEASVD